MSDKPKADPRDLALDAPAVRVPTQAAETTPFIYFDGVSTFGVYFGAIQIELGANVIVATPDGNTKTIIRLTAHLRCSPHAAADLRDNLDKVLAMAAGADAKG